MFIILSIPYRTNLTYPTVFVILLTLYLTKSIYPTYKTELINIATLYRIESTVHLYQPTVHWEHIYLSFIGNTLSTYHPLGIPYLTTIHRCPLEYHLCQPSSCLRRQKRSGRSNPLLTWRHSRESEVAGRHKSPNWQARSRPWSPCHWRS